VSEEYIRHQATECKAALVAARDLVESLVAKYRGHEIAPHLADWRKLRFVHSPYPFEAVANWHFKALEFAACRDVEDLVAAMSDYQQKLQRFRNVRQALPPVFRSELRRGLEKDLPGEPF
jgi:hypothetical protein